MLRRTRKTIAVCLLAVVGIVLAAAPARGQSYDETLYVDAETSSDENLGTEAKPFRSIQKAMNRATDYKNEGRSVNVVIAPGVYREAVQFAYSNYNGRGTNAPVLVEGSGPEQTVIKGSEVFEGWQREGGGVFSHEWTKDWGIADDPTGNYITDCGAHPKFCAENPKLVLRREMVFINGRRMRQVLFRDAMEPGTFFVDESDDTLYLQPLATADLSDATVEVSVRPRGWFTDVETNVTIRDLSVQHVATPWQNGLGAIVLSGSNHTAENVKAVDNNYIGLYTSGNGVTVKNPTLNRNGHSGIRGLKTVDLVVEGGTVNANNWRGALGGYTGWSVGNKFFRGRNVTIRGTSFKHNQSRGVWFDTDHTDVLLEDVEAHGNLRDNIWVEKTRGPVTLRRVVSTGSDGYGLLLANAQNTTVTDARLVENEKGGIHISGDEEGVNVQNFETGEPMVLKTRHFSLHNSVIRGVGGGVKGANGRKGRFLIGTTFDDTWDDFLATYEADYNIWYNAEDPKAFEWRANKLISFEEWQKRTGEDQNSVFKAPQDSNLTGTDDSRYEVADGNGAADTAGVSIVVQTTTPTSLTAAADSGAIQLNWTAPETGNVSRYNIYRDTSSLDATGGPSAYSPVDSTTGGGTSFTDDLLTPGTDYYYRVTAVRTDGSESGFSNQSTETPEGLVASQSATVESSNEAVQVNFDRTGTGLNFTNGVKSAGSVTTEQYSGEPEAPNGINDANISDHRLTIDSDADFDEAQVKIAVKNIDGVDDPSAIDIYKRDTPGSWEFTKLNTMVENDTLVATTGSFSEFALASDTNPLPVELTRFDARLEEETVLLTWTTAFEQNNAFFEVQRRVEEDPTSTWTRVGRVSGSGTTTERQSYHLTDADLPPEADPLTYRLKQMDKDGTVHYSSRTTLERNVQTVQLPGVVPNPASQQATVRYTVPEAEAVTIRLYDALGRRMQTIVNERQQAGPHEHPIEVQGLSSGVYFLRLTAGGVVQTKKFTVVQ